MLRTQWYLRLTILCYAIVLYITLIFFLVCTLCGNCPQPSFDWVQVGGDWYLRLGIIRTFQSTVDACILYGGQLAVIYDQATHDAIYKLTGIVIDFKCCQTFANSAKPTKVF